MKNFSRRDIVTAAAGTALAVKALAQNPPVPSADTASADLAKAARDANQRNSETLAKFEMPIATEPAFQFKA